MILRLVDAYATEMNPVRETALHAQLEGMLDAWLEQEVQFSQPVPTVKESLTPEPPASVINQKLTTEDDAPAADLGPDAWLFTCKKPGSVMQYASISETDNQHYPLDQWKSVTVTPLYKAPAIPAARVTGKWDSDRIFDYNDGWNACREAMLAAFAEHTEQPLEMVQPAASANGTIELFGVKYALELFESFGFAPVGTLLRILKRRDGTLTVAKAGPDVPMTQEQAEKLYLEWYDANLDGVEIVRMVERQHGIEATP